MSRPPLRRRRAWAAWLVVLAGAAALGGCGSSSSGNGVASKSPMQILDAAVTAARSAATVHVSGSMSDEGKPVSLDLELEAGKGGKGTIALEGVSVKLVHINGAVYLNGSEAFYRRVAGASAAQLLRGKWLKAPASDVNFASLASLTDLDRLISSTLAAHGALVGAGTSTLEGHRVVGVTDRTRGGTLYVATTGAAYPLEIAKGGSSGGRITFDRWNQPVTLEAPPGALNINQLRSGR